MGAECAKGNRRSSVYTAKCPEHGEMILEIERKIWRTVRTARMLAVVWIDAKEFSCHPMRRRKCGHLIFEYGLRAVPGLRKGNLVADRPRKPSKLRVTCRGK
jgi:hypothetical protein